MKKKRGRILLYILIAGVLTAAGIGWNLYKRVFSPNINIGKTEKRYLYIPTNAGFQTVVDSLTDNDLLKRSEDFIWVAEKMQYNEHIRPGRYSLKNGMSNRELVTLLRSGKQEPVNVTFNNIRTIEQLAGRISKTLEADSVSLVKIFRDETLLQQNKLNTFNSISIIIPNTYEFFWNTSALQFYERMSKEYHRFWNEARLMRLKETGLTQLEISVIASIVEQETNKDDEKPVIAGVYINRFKQGWKLEADPTLVYALGDFTIRRVLNQHKEIESPYNTYLNTGLPPGPICIPDIVTLDAVLNYSKHDFYYFCAKDDFSGYHAFASSYQDHLLNARRFHRALSRRGIMS
jgi:UPF0755 protein